MPLADSGDGRRRYEVVLAERATERVTSFRTSAFTGPGRVDLEDACEWGAYDTVIVRRQRGEFTEKEMVRCLDEVLADLMFDHGHQFFVLEATSSALTVCLHSDFDVLADRAGGPFRERLIDVLRLCGFTPRTERETRSWLDLSVGPEGLRRLLVIPKTKAAGQLGSVARRGRSGDTLVLIRPQDPDPEPDSPEDSTRLPLGTLIHQLHQARIATLALKMRASGKRKGSRKAPGSRAHRLGPRLRALGL